MTRAVAAGCRALVLTVDVPVVGKRERELRHGWALRAELVPAFAAALGRDESVLLASLFDPSVGWEMVDELRDLTGVPVVVKGLLTAEDALLAAERGAAAVVVSNHGGRQLDGVAPALEALPEVVDAVGGRAEVWLDGGVRRGTDVAKALALGARVVLAGRAPLWGLAAAGQEGVEAVLRLLRDELATALALLGCRSPGELEAAHVRVPQPSPGPGRAG